MGDEIKNLVVIVVISTLAISFFVNITRIIWTNTGDDSSRQAHIACLEGGGSALLNGFGGFIRCEKVTPQLTY